MENHDVKQKVIIAGGSGFIGRALAEQLSGRGYEVVILSRQEGESLPRSGVGVVPGVVPGVRVVGWDGRTLSGWEAELNGAYALVNLAGKNVSCRYHRVNRIAMNRSRVDSTRALGQAITQCTQPPNVWVQASTTALFGDRGDEWLDEDSYPGDGYPTETAMLWEDAFQRQSTPDMRRVLLRISFVLGRGGGALSMLSTLTRCYLGGSVGSGSQYISWIHIDDLCRLVQRSIEDPSMQGMYCATGLNPVTNRRFMQQMRRALHRPWSPPAPAPMVRLGAYVLGSWGNLALWGRRVQPRRLLEAGFQFKYTHLEDALNDIYSQTRTERTN